MTRQKQYRKRGGKVWGPYIVEMWRDSEGRQHQKYLGKEKEPAEEKPPALDNSVVHSVRQPVEPKSMEVVHDEYADPDFAE